MNKQKWIEWFEFIASACIAIVSITFFFMLLTIIWNLL